MSTLHLRRAERRRTSRVAVFAELTVHGYTEWNEKFTLQTRSLSASAHGGMTILDTPVTVGQTLLLINENSKQKAECRVVYIRPMADGKIMLSFEFLGPYGDFWKMTFPACGSRPLRRLAAAVPTS